VVVGAIVSPGECWSVVALAAVACAAICAGARRWPGGWREVVARVIGVAFAADRSHIRSG